MKWLLRVLPRLRKKQSTRKQNDARIVDNPSRSVDVIEVPRAPGGSKEKRELTPDEKLEKCDMHASEVAKLDWNCILIYTDAGDKDGKRGMAGWFGTGHRLNFGEPLKATHPKMKHSEYLEMIAVQEALNRLSQWSDYCCQPVMIFTDNEQVVRLLDPSKEPTCQNEYAVRKAKEIRALILETFHDRVQVRHVKGHIGIPGNEKALVREVRQM
ncbi:unnamed protein product, partial [Mesorhabditis belari]|uniref:RNase H type-1 domain-containing protein n=1 Tax=Mesorhabditis belari TaxID=2138241 RepID=A0AAF3FPB5_9BILA